MIQGEKEKDGRGRERGDVEDEEGEKGVQGEGKGRYRGKEVEGKVMEKEGREGGLRRLT